jgi:diguanylate cyclase (GGDEF)-like protein
VIWDQMGRWCWACVVCVLLLAMGAAPQKVTAGTTPFSVQLNVEEQAWLAANRGKPFSVGFDPVAGLDYFEFRGQHTGLLPAMIADIDSQLGLKLVPVKVKDWDDAYTRFVAGQLDILYGANPTLERSRIMWFTRPVWKYPYNMFGLKDSSVQTLGDLDGKKVGFLRNDFVAQQLPKEFPNIHIQSVEFDSQEQGLRALEAGQIDGFVNDSGGMGYEISYLHPKVALVAQIRSITSDMTMAVAKDKEILGRILDRYMAQRELAIRAMKRNAEKVYNRKTLRLTETELRWLEQNGTAVVGVAEDYLPFDYYSKGQYRGIAGEMLKRIGDSVGIRFKVVSGTFAEIMDQARSGGVDVVDMAKTEDRLKDFIFPHAISTERDIIVGLKSSAPVQDVYGLEGKRVAVIEGFWHEEYLRKNLKNAQIVTTADIMESLRLLRRGDVAYVIENPTVVEFYINGLGYTDIVKRGSTSKDSFVYFGVSRRQPELASIMDKVIPQIDFEDVKYVGIQSVPALHNEANTKLLKLIGVLVLVLIGILLLVAKVVRSLAEEKSRAQFLTERESLLYTDVLTGFFNRNYLSQKADQGVAGAYPQAVVVADVNNLKQINDSYGHAAGDALLVAFTTLVRQQWPQGHFFRLGGDEFLIILPATDADRVQTDLLALTQRCQQTHYAVSPTESAQPSAALGYAIRSSAEVPLTACIAEADQRMYQAKAQMKKRRSDHVLADAALD